MTREQLKAKIQPEAAKRKQHDELQAQIDKLDAERAPLVSRRDELAAEILEIDAARADLAKMSNGK